MRIYGAAHALKQNVRQQMVNDEIEAPTHAEVPPHFMAHVRERACVPHVVDHCVQCV